MGSVGLHTNDLCWTFKQELRPYEIVFWDPHSEADVQAGAALQLCTSLHHSASSYLVPAGWLVGSVGSMQRRSTADVQELGSRVQVGHKLNPSAAP